MSCLLINDIDAGLGHFANTQVRSSIELRADMPLVQAIAGWQAASS